MSKIKGLILKDFYTLQSYKTTILIIFIIFLFGSFFNEGIAVFLPLCFGMLGLSSFSFDSNAKSDKYLLTFPINKKDFVKARYIYMFLFILFGMVLGLICTIIVQLFNLKNSNIMQIIGEDFLFLLYSSLAIIILQSIQIPIMYKYGAEKGRIIQLIVIVLLSLCISILFVILGKIINFPLDSLITMIKNYIVLIIGSIAILSYLGSYTLSCKIYKKKEF